MGGRFLTVSCHIHPTPKRPDKVVCTRVSAPTRGRALPFVARSRKPLPQPSINPPVSTFLSRGTRPQAAAHRRAVRRHGDLAAVVCYCQLGMCLAAINCQSKRSDRRTTARRCAASRSISNVSSVPQGRPCPTAHRRSGLVQKPTRFTPIFPTQKAAPQSRQKRCTKHRQICTKSAFPARNPPIQRPGICTGQARICTNLPSMCGSARPVCPAL